MFENQVTTTIQIKVLHFLPIMAWIHCLTNTGKNPWYEEAPVASMMLTNLKTEDGQINLYEYTSDDYKLHLNYQSY